MGVHSICEDVSTHMNVVVCLGFPNGQKMAEVEDLGLPLRLLIELRGLPLRLRFKKNMFSIVAS